MQRLVQLLTHLLLSEQVQAGFQVHTCIFRMLILLPVVPAQQEVLAHLEVLARRERLVLQVQLERRVRQEQQERQVRLVLQVAPAHQVHRVHMVRVVRVVRAAQTILLVMVDHQERVDLLDRLVEQAVTELMVPLAVQVEQVVTELMAARAARAVQVALRSKLTQFQGLSLS